MLKERAIHTATYLLAYSVALSAGVLSVAMIQVDNLLHKGDKPEASSKGKQPSRISSSGTLQRS